MVQKKQRKNVAFGYAAQRFKNTGLHPFFEKRGYTYRYPHVSPGSYHKERVKKPKGIWYKRSLETEELSRTLGHRADKKLRELTWIRSINGPGWHNVEYKPLPKGGTFANASRFPAQSGMATPGPGVYGVPHMRMEKKLKSKTFCDTPSFEYDNCQPRQINQPKSYHLPPNIYKVKSGIEELLAKSVSRRGPYDLFTGARDETSLYGHLAKRRLQRNESRIPDCRSGVERLNDKCNKFKGKFMKCGRETFPPIRIALMHPNLSRPDPKSPAPNQYDIQKRFKPEKIQMFPFGSSVLHARPVLKIAVNPPPGRYDQDYKREILGNGMRSAFLSRVNRELPIPEKLSWF